MMKRNLFTLILLTGFIILSSCSAQRQLTSKMVGDWNIDKYEIRSPGGERAVIENAGTINFSGGSQGSQTFTTAIIHAGSDAQKEFTWENTTRTISIKSASSEYPKNWIVVKDGKRKQQWYSTDDTGNVQVMHLSKKN